METILSTERRTEQKSSTTRYYFM